MVSGMVSQAAYRSPLKSFRCFESTEVDEAREIVARHFCNHRLERMSSKDSFDACQNRVEGRRLSLNYIRYGGDVAIEPGELSDFYLIQIPIAGTAQVSNGCRTVSSTSKTGAILNPDRHTTMRWHAGCEQILLQVEQTYVQEIATRITGLPVQRVRFSSDFDLEAPSGKSWARFLRGAVGAAEDGLAFRTPDRHQQLRLEEGLIATLLTTQPNTISPLLERSDTQTSPAILRRAIHLINDRFDDDISLLDICVFARTTPRNLQILFKRDLGCSPIQYLQNVRLKFARHLLLSEGGNRSIADIADCSGHRHLGRFSAAYKKSFGETPKETSRIRPFG
jgi:AraC-like DNA-binding protein